MKYFKAYLKALGYTLGLLEVFFLIFSAFTDGSALFLICSCAIMSFAELNKVMIENKAQ